MEYVGTHTPPRQYEYITALCFDQTFLASMMSGQGPTKACDLHAVHVTIHGASWFTLCLDKSSKQCIDVHVEALKKEFLRKVLKATAAPYFSVQGCASLRDVSAEEVFDIALGMPLSDDKGWIFSQMDEATGAIALVDPDQADRMVPQPRRSGLPRSVTAHSRRREKSEVRCYSAR